MAAASNRTLGTWLAASVVGAAGLVGMGSLGDHRPRAERVVVTGETGTSEDELSTCDLGGGKVGHLYNDLCLDAPPFGWVSPAQ